MREEMVKSSKWQKSLTAGVVVAAILLVATTGMAMTGTSLADNSEPASGPVDKEFTLWARQFEYVPAVIEVQQGDYVRLKIKTADVTHGFYIDGYDVDIKVTWGETESIEFVADKAGTFKFRCSSPCGPFHPFMAGKFVVRQSPDIIPWTIIAGTVAVSVLSVGIPAFQLWRRNGRDKGK
jgi:cytochrome c oxidase subunit 2